MTHPPHYMARLILLLLALASLSLHAEEDVLKRRVQLPEYNGSAYQLFALISEQIGYYFTYDSRLVDSERRVSFSKGEYEVEETLRVILNDTKIRIRVIGRQIVFHLPQTATDAATGGPAKSDSIIAADSFITLQGVVRDQYSSEPIPYVSLGVLGSSLGTITNQDGEFRLRLSTAHQGATIYFSHLGYIPRYVDNELLHEGYNEIELEQRVVPIQEVLVMYENPLKLMKRMVEQLEANAPSDPYYMMMYYREGVMMKRRLMDLTEGVMQVYKTPGSLRKEQMKLMKMRRIVNMNQRDTLIAKFKSGLDAILALDLVKYQPNFFDEDRDTYYDYTHSDIIVFEERLANVVSFHQKNNIGGPLFCGELYIDAENDALLGAQFEINPKYVKEATKLFVNRQSRQVDMEAKRILYTVSYKEWQGKYYLNHIRGDLEFRVKKRRQLFSSSALSFWFEMVNCGIEKEGVTRFDRHELLPTHTILADTRYHYDAAFWRDFNIILPEESLLDAISKINARIEQVDY